MNYVSIVDVITLENKNPFIYLFKLLNILLNYVVLPDVLDLAVNLVNFLAHVILVSSPVPIRLWIFDCFGFGIEIWSKGTRLGTRN